jgi:hypothetical protein
MATSFRLEHQFPTISIDIFEKYLNHPELNKMLSRMPSFKERTLVEENSENNNEQEWKFLVRAASELPQAIKKVIPTSVMSWHEKSLFKKNEHTIYWSIIPLDTKIKFKGSGTWKLFEENSGTKRVIEGEIRVEIPFVGKMIENFIVKELQKNYEEEPLVQKAFYESICK